MHRKSLDLDQIVPALIKARNEIPLIGFNAETVVGKDKKTHRYIYRGYATLDNLIESTRHILAANGIVVVMGEECTHSPSDGRVTARWITATALHTSGQWITHGVTVPDDRGEASDHWGNITSGRRYAYMSILNLSVAEETDSAAQQTSTPRHEHQEPQRSQPDPEPTSDVSVATQIRSALKPINAISPAGEKWSRKGIEEYIGCPIDKADESHVKKLRDLYAQLKVKFEAAQKEEEQHV